MICCVDIGGTSIKIALTDSNNELINHETIMLEDNLEFIVNSIKAYLSKYDTTNLEGITFSLPGIVNDDTGFVLGHCAVSCLHTTNVKEYFKSAFNLNIALENDANCAALAESFNGSAKDVNDTLFIVCGTGIGGAIIKDKKVHVGKNLYAGEFGFMLMPTEEGMQTLSMCASTMSVVRKARKHFNDESIDGKFVFNSDDAYCKGIVETFYYNLAVGIFNLQHAYDPELILLGGAISVREDFIERLNEQLTKVKEQVGPGCLMPQITTCTHKNNANLFGALANYYNKY